MNIEEKEVVEEKGLVRVVDMKKIALTVNEVSEFTGIGRNAIRNLITWGKLPAIHIGSKAVIRVDTLDRFLQVNEGIDITKRFEVVSV